MPIYDKRPFSSHESNRYFEEKYKERME